MRHEVAVRVEHIDDSQARTGAVDPIVRPDSLRVGHVQLGGAARAGTERLDSKRSVTGRERGIDETEGRGRRSLPVEVGIEHVDLAVAKISRVHKVRLAVVRQCKPLVDRAVRGCVDDYGVGVDGSRPARNHPCFAGEDQSRNAGPGAQSHAEIHRRDVRNDSCRIERRRSRTGRQVQNEGIGVGLWFAVAIVEDRRRGAIVGDPRRLAGRKNDSPRVDQVRVRRNGA